MSRPNIDDRREVRGVTLGALMAGLGTVTAALERAGVGRVWLEQVSMVGERTFVQVRFFGPLLALPHVEIGRGADYVESEASWPDCPVVLRWRQPLTSIVPLDLPVPAHRRYQGTSGGSTQSVRYRGK